jgi:Bifunctional DNA primase/polymerase, N-terminal
VTLPRFPTITPAHEPTRLNPGVLLDALGDDLAPARAAEAYAALGYPVLPCFEPAPDGGCTCRAGARCHRPGKHPRLRADRPGRGGVHEATCDLATVRRWWRRWPTANVAIRTGDRFDVADIDSQDGVEALRAILHHAGAVHEAGPLARTGGGGWHLLFAPTGAGSPGEVLPGVDWRGQGGYVLVAPSRHPSGRRYRWVRPLSLELPEAPAALRALLASPVRPGTPRGAAAGVRVVGGGYGRAALRSECARLAATPPGEPGRKGRNHALYLAAFRLGRLAAAGHLDPAEITEALTEVGRQVGLAEREIGPTIASGLRNGATHPRTDLPEAARREDDR